MTWRWKASLLGAFIVMLVSACSLVVPNIPPLASFSIVPEAGYAPLRVEVDGTGSSDPDGTIRDLAWDFGDGTPGASDTACVHSYAEDGDYTLVLRVRDDRGAEATTSRGVTVYNPSPVPVIRASSTAGASPLTVALDARGSYDASGHIESYAWDFDDGTVGSGTQVTHTFRATGSAVFSVSLVATDDDGAAASSSVSIRIQGSGGGTSNRPPIASFEMSPTGGIVPLTVDFDASGSRDPDGRIVSYAWAFGDGGTGSGMTPHHTFATAGNRQVALTVRDNDGATSRAVRDLYVGAEIPDPPPPPP